MMAKKKSSYQSDSTTEVADSQPVIPNSLSRKPEKQMEAFCACDWGLLSREKSEHGGWVETHAMRMPKGRALIRTIAWPEIGKPSVALQLVGDCLLSQSAGPGKYALTSKQ